MNQPRSRALGLRPEGATGTFNAITDVPGVEVGYETIVAGDDVRTGVTVILPRGREGVGRSCAAGWFSLNGNGEMTGTTYLEETGALSLPIALTNTHAIGPVHQGVIDWSLRVEPKLAERWLLPVIAETWDGYLNDVNGGHVTSRHAAAALDRAVSGELAEGSVGGGTGMNCFGYKGGTGTASRTVSLAGVDYTLGALVQANFGERRELTVLGHRVGPQLASEPDPIGESWNAPAGAGSCIVVIATDAPLLPGQCKALARRVPLGLARTGTTGSHYSGDLFLAFSTANDDALDAPIDQWRAPDARVLRFLPWSAIDSLYEAVVEAVEEAVLNVLAASTEMTGRAGRRSPAFPHERLPSVISSCPPTFVGPSERS